MKLAGCEPVKHFPAETSFREHTQAKSAELSALSARPLPRAHRALAAGLGRLLRGYESHI